MSLSGHVDNRKKDVQILGKCPMKGLGDSILTVEKEYRTIHKRHPPLKSSEMLFKFALCWCE